VAEEAGARLQQVAGLSEDSVLSAREKVGRLLAALELETSAPSAEVGGLGGPITSDYVRSNILIALRNVGTPGLISELAPAQAAPETRLLIDLARALAGDRAAAPVALDVLASNAGPFVRRCAIDVICQYEMREAIPLLKEALADESFFVASEGLEAGQEVYPLRAAAAFALKRLGVSVLQKAPYDYEVRPEQTASASQAPALAVPALFFSGRLVLPVGAIASRVGLARQVSSDDSLTVAAGQSAVLSIDPSTGEAETCGVKAQVAVTAVAQELLVEAALLARALQFQYSYDPRVESVFIWPFAVAPADAPQ